MGKIKDRIRVRYGRLIALTFVGRDQWRHAIWRCLCDCGKLVDICGGHLQSENTTSCGCYQKEIAAANGINSNTTHGKTNTKVYVSWVSMKNRCINKSHPSYKNYGGRGITVCDRWLHSFENFFFDMCTSRGLEDVPEGLSLDRIDNNLGYFNENCRWATPKEQANNKRPRNTT